MVSFDRVLPALPPHEQALVLVRDRRYVIFKDNRGVVYCEKVDHKKVVMSCLGKTQGGKPTVYRDVVHWQGKEDMFMDQVQALSECGYTIEPDMVYLDPNYWGLVKVLKVVRDNRLGAKLSKILNNASPEGIVARQSGLPYTRVPSIPNARPLEPFTSHVLRQIDGRSSGRRADYAEMHNGPKLTALEQDWLDRWVAFG